MEINKMLQMGRETLLKNGIDPREARFLLAFAMNIKNEELIKYRDCKEEEYNKYLEVIKRRINGEPYAYIVGFKEFMKLKFKVNENVLIPSEDTEILVQEIIDRCSKVENKDIKILDMCTGSGCIAISLAKYIKNAELVAVDISEEALQVAKENAVINEVNINFIKSNLFENLIDKPYSLDKNLEKNKIKDLQDKYKFDIIVSNPPYIKKEIIKTLQKEVQKEPQIALDGGETGLIFYESITKESLNHLNCNGILAFEIGFDQGLEVAEIMRKYNYKEIEIIKDFSGNNRVVIGKLIKGEQ